MPNGPAVSSLRPPAAATSVAISALRSSHRAPRRGAAKAWTFISLSPYLTVTQAPCCSAMVELDLVIRANRHEQAAEVLAFPYRMRLVDIPRPALGPRHACRTSGLSQLVVERLVLVVRVVCLR